MTRGSGPTRFARGISSVFRRMESAPSVEMRISLLRRSVAGENLTQLAYVWKKCSQYVFCRLLSSLIILSHLSSCFRYTETSGESPVEMSHKRFSLSQVRKLIIIFIKSRSALKSHHREIDLFFSSHSSKWKMLCTKLYDVVRLS